MSTLYRVIRRSAGSKQPNETHWSKEVLYCGSDRSEARRVYHESEPEDSDRGYGNPATETKFEVIEDAKSDDAADDLVESAE